MIHPIPHPGPCVPPPVNLATRTNGLGSGAVVVEVFAL